MTDREQPRDWHQYECPHGHLWLSAPGSTACPVCGSRAYEPFLRKHGRLVIETLRDRFTEEARQYWAGDMPRLAPLLEPEFALLVAENDNYSRKVDA